ncbi:MAG TPA: hypothetical protein VLJ13_03765 [Brevundimonas sp.]|nr:hypothetical protein [Brevundimonas sp.]
MTDLFYTYVARSRSDAATFLDIGEADACPDPTAHALGLLDDHPSCDHVEIWVGEACVAVLSRQGQTHVAEA